MDSYWVFNGCHILSKWSLQIWRFQRLAYVWNTYQTFNNLSSCAPDKKYSPLIEFSETWLALESDMLGFDKNNNSETGDAWPVNLCNKRRKILILQYITVDGSIGWCLLMKTMEFEGSTSAEWLFIWHILHMSLMVSYYRIHWTVHSSSSLFELCTWLVWATEIITWHANPCYIPLFKQGFASHMIISVAQISHVHSSNNEDESIVIFGLWTVQWIW